MAVGTVAEKVKLSPQLLDYICCPACGGDLRDANSGPGAPDQLICTKCARSFNVLHGVPILLSDPAAAELFTARNFGQQWQFFDQLGGLGREFEENQFVEYLYPTESARLQGKTVLEAGCGYGRNLLAAQKYGAKVAIGMDISPAAFITKRKGIDAVIGDILNPPFRKKFDVVFTFGVLQHVSTPEQGFKRLFGLLRPGGLFCHSVYAAENNWFLSHLLTPIREKVFRHLPTRANWLIASVLGALSYPAFALGYGPFLLTARGSAWASKHLFYYDFIAMFLRKLGFKTWVAQIFDHLNAPLARYFFQNELIKWTEELGLKNTFFYFRNKNTWNFGGTK